MLCRLFKAKEQDLDTHQPEVSVPGKCSVIRMRGLPFSACIGDILDFFKGIPSLDKESVYLVYDSGRPSGEAYIMFSNSEGCAAAMRLHKQKMGSRYIELFPSSNADVQRAAKQRKLRLCKPEGVTPRAVPRDKAPSVEPKAIKPAVPAKGAACLETRTTLRQHYVLTFHSRTCHVGGLDRLECARSNVPYVCSGAAGF